MFKEYIKIWLYKQSLLMGTFGLQGRKYQADCRNLHQNHPSRRFLQVHRWWGNAWDKDHPWLVHTILARCCIQYEDRHQLHIAAHPQDKKLDKRSSKDSPNYRRYCLRMGYTCRASCNLWYPDLHSSTFHYAHTLTGSEWDIPIQGPWRVRTIQACCIQTKERLRLHIPAHPQDRKLDNGSSKDHPNYRVFRHELGYK